MKNAKKPFCLLLALLCLVSVALTGCGEVANEDEPTLVQTTAPTTAITNPNTSPTIAPTTEPASAPTTTPTTAPTTKPATAPATTPTVPAETVHTHSWKAATCTAPKTCTSCSATEGSAKPHSYSQGTCATCGATDPNYSSNPLVWIPTNGGKKYHSKSTCSKMIDPKQVTKSEAISLGFDPCGRCY